MANSQAPRLQNSRQSNFAPRGSTYTIVEENDIESLFLTRRRIQRATISMTNIMEQIQSLALTRALYAIKSFSYLTETRKKKRNSSLWVKLGVIVAEKLRRAIRRIQRRQCQEFLSAVI
jgi:hypothetical protein